MTNPALIAKLKGEDREWPRKDAARLLMILLHEMDHQIMNDKNVRTHYETGGSMLRIMQELLDAGVLEEDGIEELLGEDSIEKLKAIWDGLIKILHSDLHYMSRAGKEERAFVNCMNELLISLCCVGFHPGMNQDSQSQ